MFGQASNLEFYVVFALLGLGAVMMITATTTLEQRVDMEDKVYGALFFLVFLYGLVMAVYVIMARDIQNYDNSDLVLTVRVFWGLALGVWAIAVLALYFNHKRLDQGSSN